MQDKTSKSQVIRLNNLANKKARRRLIGSIFLLIIALLILFHVSSKIKPIQIKPESIELKTHNKTNSSDVLNNPIIIESRANISNNQVVLESNNINTNTVAHGSESTNQVSSKTVNKLESSTSIHKTINTNNSTTLKPSSAVDILDDKTGTADDAETKPLASKPTKTVNLHITPTIAIEQGSIRKATPEDILNGTIPDKARSKYFVQLMASSDKTKLIAAKNKLAHGGVYASIQSAKHGDNTIYRLRIGPFNDKNKAKSKLAEVQEKLNN